MPAPAPPIYGRVLPPAPQQLHAGPPPIEEPLTGRRGGRKKGTPNRPKPVAPLDEFNVEALRSQPPVSTVCRGCQREITPMGWDLLREMVRSSRDRMGDSEPEQRGKLAETDLLYLGARLDGFCSLTCCRASQA